jgi:hypothetical protein
MLDEFIKPIVTDREPHLLRLTGIGIEVAGKLRPAAPQQICTQRRRGVFTELALAI